MVGELLALKEYLLGKVLSERHHLSGLWKCNADLDNCYENMYRQVKSLWEVCILLYVNYSSIDNAKLRSNQEADVW